MELATQNVLNQALCSTQPTWTFRTKDGSAILRFSTRIEDDAYGHLCVDLDGQRQVKSFYYYPRALPTALPVGLVLQKFLETLGEEAGLDVKYVGWSEDAKYVKVSKDLHVLTVATEVVAYTEISVGEIARNLSPVKGFEGVVGRLSSAAFLAHPVYFGPLPFKPKESITIKRVCLADTFDRVGVYLTESLGQAIAIKERLDESLTSDLVIIEFPLDTKIVTVDFLSGLLLEVYCQCASASHFLNRYRLVGANDIKRLLNEFISSAVCIKQQRNQRCLKS